MVEITTPKIKKAVTKTSVKKSRVTKADKLELNVNKQLSGMMELIKIQGEMLKSMAKNNPVRVPEGYDTRDNEVGQSETRIMESTGPAELSLSPPEFKVVGDKQYSPDKLATLAFMEEELTIRVMDSTNENDVYIPAVYNDGRAQYFVRNMEQTVKRKYVEVLARAKKTTYSQQKATNFNGDEYYKNIPHTALVYPFQVISDPSGVTQDSKGYQWLKAIQLEAA
jgi:hypothetical protein